MPTIQLHRRTPLILMTTLALWLGSHPWHGIWHDAMLYAVQALRRLSPENFQADLYFLHGSQDAFTLFSPIYAAAIDHFGLQAANNTLLLVGFVLWAAAAAYLSRALLRGFYFWLALAMLFTWPSDYGPTPDVFRLAEPFLTPRLFAEGLGILALGCFMRQRWAWGMLAAGAALTLHPLMACAPLLAGVLLLAWGNWRTLAGALLAGAGLGVMLVVAGIPPFDRLLLSMDAEWLSLIQQRSPMNTWTAWQWQEWVSRAAVAFGLLAPAAFLASGMTARLFRCALVLGALGLLASWLGTGLGNNLLLIQVQPWRLLWMTQLCSWLALAWLLSEYWQRGRLSRALLLILCLAALTRDSVGGAAAVLAGLALYRQAQGALRYWPSWGNAAFMACAVGLLLAWVVEVSLVTAFTLSPEPHPAPLWVAAVWLLVALKLGASAALWMALLAAVWSCAGSQRKGRQLLGFGLAFSALCLATLYAVQPLPRQYDLSPAGERAVRTAFLPLVPPGAVVYWQNNVTVSWFVLRRANYASNVQVTGLAFNRGTAVEGARRMARLARLGGEDTVASLTMVQTRLGAKLLPEPSAQGLAYVCADPVLDFVVLGTQLDGGAIAQARDAGYGKDYYLFDCARLRRPKAPPGSGNPAGAAPGDSLSIQAPAARNK